MKAMILAAGLGTRLRPLTESRPKALVPVGNRPIIDLTIDHLKRHGAREVVVNAHHHHEQIAAHLDRGRSFGLPIELSIEPEILGTGGGIKKVEGFWDKDPFVVVNSDILTDVDIRAAYAAHLENKNMATLVVHDHAPFNQLAVDDKGNITDIASQNLAHRLAFTGIHVIEPEVLNHIPENAFYNIIDCYRALIRAGSPIRAWRSVGHYWRDIGTVESYRAANQDSVHGQGILAAPGVRISKGAMIEDWAVLGKNAVLDDGVVLRRSILWDEVKIKKGVKVIYSIVTDHQEVNHDLIQAIY